MWNLNTNSIIKRLVGHTSGVRCVAIYQKSKLITGGVDKSIKIWNLLTGDVIDTLLGHTDEVWSLKLLDYSSNGNNGSNLLASGSDDIKIWELKSSRCLYTLKGHTWYVFCLEKLSDEYLISMSRDKSIRSKLKIFYD